MRRVRRRSPRAVRVRVPAGVMRFEDLVPPTSSLEAIREHLDGARLIGTRVVIEPPMYRGVTIVAQLRAPDGCPWDREQTHESLVANLLEEAYEVADAIRTRDSAHLREELGDLLLQVVLHAQIASEDGRFTVEEVAREIGEKLVRRHPHVFGESEAHDTGAPTGIVLVTTHRGHAKPKPAVN